MIGRNSIVMNQAEIVRALEYYLNSVHFKERVKVTNVSENKAQDIFVVNLEEPDEPLLDEKEVAKN